MTWRTFDQMMASVPFFDGIMATALSVTVFGGFRRSIAGENDPMIIGDEFVFGLQFPQLLAFSPQ